MKKIAFPFTDIKIDKWIIMHLLTLEVVFSMHYLFDKNDMPMLWIHFLAPIVPQEMKKAEVLQSWFWNNLTVSSFQTQIINNFYLNSQHQTYLLES